MITLINVFAVEPANQQRLVDLLTRATDDFVSRAPGFLSATLHRSLDGAKVTMYAQWRSVEDYEAMRRDPGPLPFLQEALTIARFDPGIYEIARQFQPAANSRPALMSSAQLSDLYRAYIACLNAQDWARLGDFVDDGVRYNDERIGLSGYRAMLERDFREIPDLAFEIGLLIAEPPRIAARLAFDCTPREDFSASTSRASASPSPRTCSMNSAREGSRRSGRSSTRPPLRLKSPVKADPREKLLSGQEIYRQGLPTGAGRIRLVLVLRRIEHRVKISRHAIGLRAIRRAAGAGRIGVAAIAGIGLSIGDRPRPFGRQRPATDICRLLAAGELNRQVIGDLARAGTIAVRVLWLQLAGGILRIAVPRAIRAIPIAGLHGIQRDHADVIPDATALGAETVRLKIRFDHGQMMLLRNRAIDGPRRLRGAEA